MQRLSQLWDRFTSYVTRPVEARLYDIFKAFLAIKFLLESVLRLGPSDLSKVGLLPVVEVLTSHLGVMLMLACAITIGSRANYKFGLLILFTLKLRHVLYEFPFTGNHYVLELVVLGVLLIYPADRLRPEAPQSPEMVDGRACRLIIFAIALVYFWAGVQKLVHGYYLNGEFFTLYLFIAQDSYIGRFLSSSIALLAEILDQSAPAAFQGRGWLIAKSYDYPAWAVWVVVIQSWLTIAAEILAPALLLFDRTRRVGKFLLVPTVIAIALVSGETGFALTNCACVLLLFPRQARWTYPVGYATILVIHYARLLGSFGV